MPGPTIQDVLNRIDALEGTLFDVAVLRQQFHDYGDGYRASIYDNVWISQTVTPQEDYKVLLVRLKLFRTGLPGDITVSIRATSEGLPIGSDICTAVLDGNNFTEDTSGLWYTFSFGLGELQLKDVKHAIVVRALNGDINNWVGWRFNSVSNKYLGGQRVHSGDGGVNWVATYGDLMFEEYTNSSLSDLHRDILEIKLKVLELKSKLPEAKIT